MHLYWGEGGGGILLMYVLEHVCVLSGMSSSAVDQPCLDPQSTCCHELGGAAQVFRRSPQLVSGWLTLRP